MLIGGDWVDAQSGETLAVQDPATGEVITHVPAGDKADVDAAVRAARKALAGPWRTMTPQERTRLMWRLADLIEAHAEDFAQIESLDNGKPVNEARFVDVPLSIEILRYYAGWPTKITGETIPVSYPPRFGGRYHAYTLREPIGVVAAIIPWNVPLLMTIKKLAPALATGNTTVFKPAEQTPLSIELLGKLVLEAGFPEGVFNFVSGYGRTAGQAMVDHMDIGKITFTGSVATGKSIVRGATSNLKRVSLELGGKSPHIIFADADLDLAIPNAALAIFACQGESCIAGSRLYVQRPVFDKVVAGISARAESIKLGRGLDPTTEMGPMISAEHREKVLQYIDIGQKEGAEVASGGGSWGDQGYFVQPTVLINPKPDARIVKEEIFGPVLSVLPFDTEEEVLAAANDSRFGLGAGVWTQDISRAQHFATSIEAGQVWINCYQACDAAVPFGGYKESGWGRETCKESLDDYLETKTVMVRY
ncbi:MAG: aldehyde dehydrogenase family protein [Sphingobium sp.]